MFFTQLVHFLITCPGQENFKSEGGRNRDRRFSDYFVIFNPLSWTLNRNFKPRGDRDKQFLKDFVLNTKLSSRRGGVVGTENFRKLCTQLANFRPLILDTKSKFQVDGEADDFRNCFK